MKWNNKALNKCKLKPKNKRSENGIKAKEVEEEGEEDEEKENNNKKKNIDLPSP